MTDLTLRTKIIILRIDVSACAMQAEALLVPEPMREPLSRLQVALDAALEIAIELEGLAVDDA